MATNDEKLPYSFRDGIKFCLPFYLRYWKDTVWSLVFNLLKTLPYYLSPIFVKVIVDNFIPAGNESAIYWMFPLIAILGLMNIYFHTLFRSVFVRVVKSISRDLRSMIVGRLQMLSLSFHDKQETGRYFSKIMVDVERIEQFSEHMSNSVFGSLVVLGLMIMVLGFVNMGILLTFMAILPAFHLLMWVFNGILRRTNNEMRVARENLSASVASFLQTSLLARLHGQETYERERVDHTSSHLIVKSTKAEVVTGLFGSMNSVIVLFFNFLVTAIVAVKVINKELTLGEMLLFVQYIQMMMGHIATLINTLPVFTMFNEAVGSIQEIVTAPDIEHNQGKRELNKVVGEIEMESVSFTYESTGSAPHRPALREVSILIPPGTTVGLVGRSGSGKTTFVNLVLGLYRTEEGRVLIDGNPINELDMRSVRKFVGVVNQEPILFTGSIFDNIAHATKDMPMEKVIEAARKASADEFIRRIPDGYQSPVGEAGGLLSGGQKQRIALARTILRDPAILVLDEATSALDSESEQMVQQAIEAMAGDRTTLIIAHRLSTIRKADLILFFEDGRIIEKGTHSELIELKGQYARMVELQSMEREVVKILEEGRKGSQDDAIPAPPPLPQPSVPFRYSGRHRKREGAQPQ